MCDFDKWWEENCMILSSDRTEAEDIYNLGVESQQVKIDELKKKYDAMYNAFIVADDCRKEWHVSYISVRKERDELQARVDNALRHVVDHGGYDDLTHAISILKGNKDETII